MAPLPDSELRRQRSRIGMVFQSFNLWPHRTAVENIMEGPIVVLGQPRSTARDRATVLMQRVGLATSPIFILLVFPEDSSSVSL